MFGHALCVQVPLMEMLGTVVGALEAHRGVAEVVENGLRFFANVAYASENRVSTAWAFCVGRAD